MRTVTFPRDWFSPRREKPQGWRGREAILQSRRRQFREVFSVREHPIGRPTRGRIHHKEIIEAQEIMKSIMIL